ncbi:MAG: archease [Actinobacteria bacterium]|nr:archease [Actinomycetota bacterium]
MRPNSYKIIGHPSDTGIKVYAKTLESLFEICAIAMFAIICDISAVKQDKVKKIIIREKKMLFPDILLVSWLERLLYIHETEKMLFSGFKIKKLQTALPCRDLPLYNENTPCNKIYPGNTGCIDSKTAGSIIIAEVFGQQVDFRLHELYIAIKATTYHKLKVQREIKTGYWKAGVIFDV